MQARDAPDVAPLLQALGFMCQADAYCPERARAAVLRNWAIIILSSAILGFFLPYLFIDRREIGWTVEGEVGFGVVIFLMLLALGKEVMDAPDGIGIFGRISRRMYERAYDRLGRHPSEHVVSRGWDSAISISVLLVVSSTAVLVPISKYFLLFGVSALAGRLAQLEFDEEGFGSAKACFCNIYALSAFGLAALGGWFVYDLQKNGLLPDSTSTAVFEVMAVYGGSFLISLAMSMVSARVYGEIGET